MEGIISRAFRGRRQSPEVAERIPPGQYLTRGFPVLSAGPTQHTPLQRWDFAVEGDVSKERRWTWDEFRGLPSETITTDIHCVTRWSKLDTQWTGVSVDTLLGDVQSDSAYLMAFSDGGYTTNLAIDDVTGGKAWVAFDFDGKALQAQHGGPARLLVPHLYFWKSAKWVRGFRLMNADNPGFWERLGYNMHGDPWKEQRYSGE